ncbi:MAG TPA: hypothetical protein VMT03_24490 [Polyangia bacterium]|nr:hypothetical protein [Polyangia bacterium]
MLVQIFAFPAAVASLGPKAFGAYASTVAAVSWVSLVSLGAPPSLTRLISAAVGRDDREQESLLFGNGLAVSVAAGMLAAILILKTATMEDLPHLLGPSVMGFEHAARTVLYILSLFIPLTLVGNVAEATYSAYQEQAITNSWSFVLSLISIPVLLLVVRWPLISVMVVGTYGPTALTKLLSLVQLVALRRPYLLRGIRRISWSASKSLLLPGGAFALISAGSYLNTQLPIFVAGWTGGTAAAQMGILMQMYTIAISVAVMVNNTLWPALIEAKQRNDFRWLAKALRHAVSVNAIVAAGSLVGLGVLTPVIASRWYRVPLSHPEATAWAMGAFMAAATFENMLIAISYGIGSLRRAAAVFVIRCAIAACLYRLLAFRFGIPGILAVGAVTALAACVALGLPYVRARSANDGAEGPSS